jgi:hypothetical protein
LSKQIRADFWKCDCVGHYLRGIHPVSETVASCCAAELNGDGFAGYAAPVEVLVAWLSADENRRRELEIASRPTKLGGYSLYRLCDGLPTIKIGFDRLTSQFHLDDDTRVMGRGLWEPITE